MPPLVTSITVHPLIHGFPKSVNKNFLMDDHGALAQRVLALVRAIIAVRPDESLVIRPMPRWSPERHGASHDRCIL